MDDLAKKHYHHGNLANALRATARVMLDEDGPEGVGLREVSRRIGVSATAAYRHFEGKNDLLASVAAGGFRELSACIDAAMKRDDSLVGMGLAYVEFALGNRGLFRLMFGPILIERSKYPELNEATAAIFRFMQVVGTADRHPQEVKPETMAAWGLIHGLSSMCVDGLVPRERVESLAQTILTTACMPVSKVATWGFFEAQPALSPALSSAA